MGIRGEWLCLRLLEALDVVATLKLPTWQVSAMTFLTRLGVLRLTGGDMAECGLPARQCQQERAYLRSTRYRVTWVRRCSRPTGMPKCAPPGGWATGRWWC